MSDTADPVATLYELHNKLSEAAKSGDVSSQSDSFEALITGVSGKNDACRQLSADFIPQFVHLFPSRADDALNAQFDLVDDGLSTVRMHAIHGLELICKNSPSLIGSIAEPLAQLLLSNEPHELAAVKKTFTALFNIDGKSAFSCLFSYASNPAFQIRSTPTPGSESSSEFHSSDSVSLALSSFLKNILEKQKAVILANEELKATVVAGLKNLLTNDAITLPVDNNTYFIELLATLTKTKKEKSEGKNEDLPNVFAAQAGLKKDFVPEDNKAVQLFIDTFVAANKARVDTTNFLNHFFTKQVNSFDKINPEQATNIIKLVASASVRLDAANARLFIANSVALLKNILKESASKDATATTPAATSSNVNFVNAEAAIYIFHQLANKAGSDASRVASGFFIATGQPTDFLSSGEEALKADLVGRLTHVRDSAASYDKKIVEAIKRVAEELKSLKGNKESTEEQKKTAATKLSALKAASRAVVNINKLVAALTNKNVNFITNQLTLSWKTPKPNANKPNSTKKPNNNNNNSNSMKTERTQRGEKRKSLPANSNKGKGSNKSNNNNSNNNNNNGPRRASTGSSSNKRPRNNNNNGNTNNNGNSNSRKGSGAPSPAPRPRASRGKFSKKNNKTRNNRN